MHVCAKCSTLVRYVPVSSVAEDLGSLAFAVALRLETGALVAFLSVAEGLGLLALATALESMLPGPGVDLSFLATFKDCSSKATDFRPSQGPKIDCLSCYL